MRYSITRRVNLKALLHTVQLVQLICNTIKKSSTYLPLVFRRRIQRDVRDEDIYIYINAKSKTVTLNICINRAIN